MLKVTAIASLIAAAAGPAAAAPLELSLPAALERARSANRALIASELAIESERRSLAAARSDFALKIVPTSTVGRLAGSALSNDTGLNATLGLQARQKLEWGTVVSMGPSYNRAGDASNTTLNVSLHQPLLGGFGPDVHLEGVRQAEFAVASAARSREQAAINIALEIVASYHEALKQERIARLSAALEERLRRHSLISARKERAGLASPMDTFRAEIRRNDAKESGNQAVSALETAMGRLRLLLALPPDTELRLSEPATPAIEFDALEERSLQARLELQQLQAELEEARRAAIVAAKATLPDLAINVSYGHAALADPSWGSLVPVTQRQWSVHLQASGDVRRAAERERHRRALLRIQALENSLAEKADDVRRQVRQQLRAIEESRSRMAVRSEQIRQAEGKLALAEVKFAHDMADNFDLIEAETELYRARGDLAAAEADLAVGIRGLRAAVGAPP